MSKTKITLAALRDIPIFQTASDATLRTILSACRESDLPAGTILLRAREASGTICFQLTGTSMIYNLTRDGKRKILFLLGRGALLNSSVLDERKTVAYCETLEQSRILQISSAVFNRCMEEDFALTRAVIASLEQKNWRLSHQLKNSMSSIYLERKLAAKLWKLARDFGEPCGDGIRIRLKLSVTILADLLGAPRETTSRVIKTLSAHDLIRMERKTVTIRPEQLALFYKSGSYQQIP